MSSRNFIESVQVAEVNEIGFATAITEPVSVETARNYLHSSEDDDEVLAVCISAARASCEDYTNRTLAKRSLELRWPEFGSKLSVSNGPIGSITEFGYITTAGTEVLFSSSDYTLEGQLSHTTAIRFKDSFTAPIDIATDITAPIFLRGSFGPDASTVGAIRPEIVQAILWTAAHFFENRSPVVTGTISSELPLGIDRILKPFRHNPV